MTSSIQLIDHVDMPGLDQAPTPASLLHRIFVNPRHPITRWTLREWSKHYPESGGLLFAVFSQPRLDITPANRLEEVLVNGKSLRAFSFMAIPVEGIINLEFRNDGKVYLGTLDCHDTVLVLHVPSYSLYSRDWFGWIRLKDIPMSGSPFGMFHRFRAEKSTHTDYFRSA